MITSLTPRSSSDSSTCLVEMVNTLPTIITAALQYALHHCRLILTATAILTIHCMLQAAAGGTYSKQGNIVIIADTAVVDPRPSYEARVRRHGAKRFKVIFKVTFSNFHVPPSPLQRRQILIETSI